jgi:hypothetical protein
MPYILDRLEIESTIVRDVKVRAAFLLSTYSAGTEEGNICLNILCWGNIQLWIDISGIIEKATSDQLKLFVGKFVHSSKTFRMLEKSMNQIELVFIVTRSPIVRPQYSKTIIHGYLSLLLFGVFTVL